MAVFSQYGEIVDVNLVRHEDTGKSKGFAFICYEDQRSTVLAVDNLNGARVLGRTIRVEHVEDYRLKDEEAAKRKDWRCGCGAENFKFRDNCHKCGGPRPVEEEEAAGEAVAPREDERPRDAEDARARERELRRGKGRRSTRSRLSMRTMPCSGSSRPERRRPWHARGQPLRVFRFLARR